MSKKGCKKIKLSDTGSDFVKNVNGKENIDNDIGQSLLNNDLEDHSWKFSHILSEPGPSNIRQDKDEILNKSKESLHERVKRRTRNNEPKYNDDIYIKEPVNKKSLSNNRNASKNKKIEDNISSKDNSITAKKVHKRVKNNITEEMRDLDVIKNKRVCKNRSLSVCGGKKIAKNNNEKVVERNVKEREVIRKLSMRQPQKKTTNNTGSLKVSLTIEEQKENDLKFVATNEHQFIDINVENIITGKRRRKTVQTYDVNVLSTYQDNVKKETVTQKKAHHGQKKFQGYIDSLLKKNIIDSKMAEEFKKLCIKNMKIPKEQGYVNDCVVKENENGGIPPCVACNEISDVILRCRWCRDAYHWICYPTRLFKYTFPKRPWRCINCHLKNLTKNEVADIKRIVKKEKNLIKETGNVKKLKYFERLNNNINVYQKLLSSTKITKMRYYNLFVNVIDKPPCDFDDESFSDSSDDEEWYRNSLHPNGLYGSLRKFCFICLKPETEVKHIMKCSFCCGQYHCDCLTPPFCYTPLDDFNCGYHISEPEKEPNLLSYDRVLDAINKYNDGGFKNNIEFELEFKNAVLEIEREEGPRISRRPLNFRRNVPCEVERYYTKSYVKLSKHFDSKDDMYRNILKLKLKNDVYEQYEQLYDWDVIGEEDSIYSPMEIDDNIVEDYLNKQISLTNTVYKSIFKVPLKAFIISKSFPVRYFFYNQLYLGNTDSKIDIKINGPPYDHCCEIKHRMVDIKFIPKFRKYELFVLGRYPVFVNGILIGKDRLSLAAIDNCQCQRYFKFNNVSKAFVPSVILKSGDIIRIGCCVILFGHA
uniref:Origin recognition complex subunit 1 n=1 Tax=Strongyloides venezuelensis TaxID=75913 RepID=A0A0K0EXG5_STRVS